MEDIWNKYKADIIIFKFMKRACISRGDLLIRPKIKTEIFELFFLIHLIGIFSSLVTLVLGTSTAF